jgi:quinol monooxygenase YgiN
VLAQAKGCRGYKVHRSQESPERYVLQVVWDTLEDHTLGFRQSPAFARWRALIGPFFAAPPTVEHFEAVTASP